MDYAKLAHWLLRAGVALAFLYPPINALFNPYTWVGYFPHWLLVFTQGLGFSDLAVLHAFGVLEVVVALWILSGKKIFVPSVAATLILLTIVALDYNQFEVLFRDLSIAAAAASLAVGAYVHRHTQ